MNSVNTTFENFYSLSDNFKRDILLYGDSQLDEKTNKFVLEAILEYINPLSGNLTKWSNTCVCLSIL